MSVVAVMAGTMAAALVPAAASEPASTTARMVTQDAASCPEQIGTVEDVAEISLECGETRVGETLSEFATGYATATGDLRMEYSTSAVRQDGDNDGGWAPVDVQVGSAPVTSGDLTGMLPVTGGVEPLWLNPGGAAGAGLPLVVLGVPAERVAMYSGSLSLADAAAGVVDDSGRRITYDFGAGVDLVVSVNTDGTTATPVVRVADLEALDHLAGDLLGGSQDLALDFPLDTADGLAVQATEAGDGFAVVDSAGEVAWESGPALMWDSAGTTSWDGVGGDPAATSALSGESRTASSEVAESQVDPTGHEARLENPVAGDTVAAMDVTVDPNADGGVVTVVPDAEMLADPDLSMPLLLDPKIGAPDPAGWAMVQNHAVWKDTPSWKYSGSEGVGLCDPNAHTECTERNVQRLLWRFSALRQGTDGVWLGDLTGSDVVRAEFAVNGTHSFDCEARSVDVYGVDTYVGSGTVWDNVNWGAMQHRWSGTHRDGCANRTTRAEFEVTAHVRTAANADESWVSVGMRAASESSMNWWKRYDGSSGTLSILFDRPPLPPTRDQTEVVPEAGAAPVDCPDWDHRVQVRESTPQLKARGSEPDGTSEVKIRFRVETSSDVPPIWYSTWSSPAGATTWRSASVPGRVNLQSGKTYYWRVQVSSTDPVSDSTKSTAWSDAPPCFFTVDTTYPNPPKVTSSNYPERRVAGGVGTPITVTFGPNGSPDVTRYWWSLNSQTFQNRRTPASVGGSVEPFDIPITRPGLNYIAVYSEDDAGLPSDATIYEFYVGFAFTTAKWQFNDTGWTAGATAASASNSENTVAGGLTASGGLSWTAGATPDALWPPDPTGEIANRKPDGAWLVNPDPATQDDVATSVKPVVNGTQSFTISAFLRADDVSQAGAAVTQVPKPAETVDGDYRSSFHLGFSKSQACPTKPDPATVDNDPETETRVLPCWAIWQVRDNEPNSETVASRTAVPAIAGQWTHVVGVYDAGTESLQAWACPMFALPAQRPVAGDVGRFEVDENGDGVIAGIDETWSPWNVAGHLRLGSGMKNGTALWPFHGAVDEVRVAAGHIYDEDTLSAICRGADVP